MIEPDLYVSWHGASWREAPQPIPAPPSPPRVWTDRIARTRRSQVGHAQRRRDARALVYACVDSCYASVNAVMHRTDLSDRTVRRVLMQGVEIGHLERIEQGRVGYTGGYPTYLYRRRQGQAQEAA